jgi:hypothetical protein
MMAESCTCHSGGSPALCSNPGHHALWLQFVDNLAAGQTEEVWEVQDPDRAYWDEHGHRPECIAPAGLEFDCTCGPREDGGSFTP